MKKQIKLLIILLVAAIVLIGAYFLVSNLLSSPTGQEQEQLYDADGDLLGTSGRPFVYPSLESEQISSITVKSKDGELTVYKDTVTDGFQIKGAEKYVYNSERISSLITACRYLLAIEKVENPEEPSYYGVTSELATAIVDVKAADGQSFRFYVGDKLVTDGAYYCKLSGKEHIYAVGTTIEDALHPLEYYINPLLSFPIAENEYYLIESFRLYHGKELFVECKRTVNPLEQEVAGDTVFHEMIYPAQYNPSDTNYAQLLLLLSSFSAQETVKINCTQADLSEFGFDAPSYTVEFSYAGNDERVLFGNTFFEGETEYIYCYSARFDIIGKTAKANLPFLDWGLIDFVDKSLLAKSIDSIDKIQVVANGVSETFVLSGSGKELSVLRQSNGKTVDTQNFRQFYRVFLLTSLSDYGEMPQDRNILLKYAVYFKDSSQMVFNFYEQTTTRCFYTVNGTGEFYVDKNDVDKIISDFGKLLSGESINADIDY